MSEFSFEYIPRDNCVCGTALRRTARCIRKTFPPGPVSFRQCRSCGTWAQSPRIDAASLVKWYNSNQYQAGSNGLQGVYLNYAGGESGRRRESCLRYNRDLGNRLPQRASILEIGCATGSLLKIVKDKGHRVTGVDLSWRFAQLARKLNGLDLVVGDFLNIDLPHHYFDCVILLGTFSNLPQINEQLAKIRTLLKPGGLLYFNIPLQDTFTAKIYGRRFWMFAPSVTNVFSKHGLLALLSRHGFTVRSFSKELQCLSLEKLLGHGGAGGMYKFFEALGLGTAAIPFLLPVPTVYRVMADIDRQTGASSHTIG